MGNVILLLFPPQGWFPHMEGGLKRAAISPPNTFPHSHDPMRWTDLFIKCLISGGLSAATTCIYYTCGSSNASYVAIFSL